MPQERKILNLCCGFHHMDDAINVDYRSLPSVDMVVDLNILPWPWANNSVDGIVAKDALEHLAPLGMAEGQRNILAVMGEIWRVLKADGQAYIMVPSTDGRGAWQDPTHVTYWNVNTFRYFTVGDGCADLYGTKTLFTTKSIRHVGDLDAKIVWVETIIVPHKEVNNETATGGNGAVGKDSTSSQIDKGKAV